MAASISLSFLHLLVGTFAILFSSPLVCSSVPLSYSINEELAAGTLVADVRRDATWLTAKHSPEVFKSLRFVALRSSSGTTSHFTVDETSGEIRTAEVIDRETLCPVKSVLPCILRIDIGVHPATHFEIIRVDITVLDVNDNIPLFGTGNNIQLTIAESSAVGSTFQLPAATDADSGDNGRIEYYLGDDDNVDDIFRLMVGRNRKPGTEADDVKLKLVRQLDREHRAGYQLIMLAADRGHVTRQTGTLTVNVVVGDVNDNAPRFERQSYEVSIPEDAPIGTTLVRMRATDPDLGENAQVRYRFSTRSQSTYGDMFVMDPTTGDVVLLQSLAYGPGDPVTSYQLSVVAEDGGQFPTPAHAALVVKVVDVNDHSPRIAIDASGTSSELSSSSVQPEVAENSPVGTFVAHVTATDADTGSNGVVQCDIVKPVADDRPADFRLVAVYEGEYQLLTGRSFDRETSSRQFAAIRCVDGGTPPRSTTRNVTVIVTDQNDNVPSFSMDVYEATVAENSPWGTIVARLAATDQDIGDNGRITFMLDRRDSMLSASGRRFHVDPDTGIVTTLAGLDREVSDLIELPVLATDAGSSAGGRQMTRAVVRVHIADVDDESPTFVRSDYAFNVDENLAVGTRVGFVSAVDLDSPPYNAFSYRLRDVITEPDAAYFRLDSESGMITTAAVFDRERRAIYRISVVAQSDTVRARADVTSVTIRIVDTNDNRPTFIFPNHVNNTVVIPLSFRHTASTSGGHVFAAKCEATDADEGPNGRLAYDIVDDGQHAAMFKIDRTSGRVMMLTENVRLKNRDGNETFSLLIRVSDEGVTSLSTTQMLHVQVVDSDDVIDYDDVEWMKTLASNSEESEHTGDSLLDRIAEWMTGGGIIIVGSCLATLGTVIVLLSVALCVVRTKRRQRSSATNRLTITKVELQPLSSSASGDLAVCHPLLESDKLRDDVTIRQFDNEPVRYVTAPYSSGRMSSINDVKVTSEHDTDSGCADVSNSDDCGSSHGSNSSAEVCAANKESAGADTNTVRSTGGATLTIDLTRRPAATLNSRPSHVTDYDRSPNNSMMTSSTLGSRKTVRFADDNPFDSGSCPRPASGEFLQMPLAAASTRSNSPTRLAPPRGYSYNYMPMQQLTSFVSVGESTGSPV